MHVFLLNAVAPLTIGTIPFTTNNSVVSISLIGEGASALTCHTELTTCCREQDNPSGGALGQWIGPDGTITAEFGSSVEGLYVTRSTNSISLNRRCGADKEGLGGLYCCVTPRAGEGTQRLCLEVNGVFVIISYQCYHLCVSCAK